MLCMDVKLQIIRGFASVDIIIFDSLKAAGKNINSSQCFSVHAHSFKGQFPGGPGLAGCSFDSSPFIPKWCILFVPD